MNNIYNTTGIAIVDDLPTTIFIYIFITILIILIYFLQMWIKSIFNKKDRDRINKLYDESIDKVYIPLIKIFSKYAYKNINEYLLKYYILSKEEQIKNILSNSYTFLSPGLDEKLNNLLNMTNKKGYKTLYDKTYYQILIDYESIKKHLGYPSMNSLNSFLRKPFKIKLNLLINFFQKLLTIFIVFLFSLLFVSLILSEFTIIKFSSLLFLAIIFLFVFYLMGKTYN